MTGYHTIPSQRSGIEVALMHAGSTEVRSHDAKSFLQCIYLLCPQMALVASSVFVSSDVMLLLSRL